MREERAFEMRCRARDHCRRLTILEHATCPRWAYNTSAKPFRVLSNHQRPSDATSRLARSAKHQDDQPGGLPTGSTSRAWLMTGGQRVGI